MRRVLVACAVVCSLLWTGVGVSVLAVAVHELSHHPHGHDHDRAVAAALHGHAHEGEPSHDHELTAPLAASRAVSPTQAVVASQPVCEAVNPSRGHPAFLNDDQLTRREHGPPAYLVNCVLLT